MGAGGLVCDLPIDQFPPNGLPDGNGQRHRLGLHKGLSGGILQPDRPGTAGSLGQLELQHLPDRVHHMTQVKILVTLFWQDGPTAIR